MPQIPAQRDRTTANPRTGEPVKKNDFTPFLALLLAIVNGCVAPTSSALDPTRPRRVGRLGIGGMEHRFC